MRILNISNLEGYGPARKISFRAGVSLAPGCEMAYSGKKLSGAPKVTGILMLEQGEEIPLEIQLVMRIAEADKKMTRWFR